MATLPASLPADEAEQLLRRAIAIAPNPAAYVDLTRLLCRADRADEAIALLDDMLEWGRRDIWILSLKTGILAAERRSEESLPLHRELISRAPGVATLWTNYANALQAVGRVDEAVTAYRRSLDLAPGDGRAWWSLANLRTVSLTSQDANMLEKVLAHAGDDMNRVQLLFALARALGDQGQFERSFHYYDAGNRLRARLIPYDPGVISEFVDRAESLFTPTFFAERAGNGCRTPGMIFIVGMPRSGSTLVEQILASHPQVEGGGELFELQNVIDRTFGANISGRSLAEAISRLPPAALEGMGKAYLASVQRHRRTNRPYFTDKMPSNWQYAPLIPLILPGAQVIDVRRDPMACCFSCFTTCFNSETSFPAGLDQLARYYSDYKRMMTHMDAALPGRILCVEFERAVDRLEDEVRRMLAFLTLPFDEGCLRFHESRRAIHTASAQQVRAPLNRDGLNRWRDYEPWLAAWSQSLTAL